MRRDPTHATLQRCSSTNLLACDHIVAAYRALSTDVTQNWSAGGVESPLPLILAQAKTHLSRACDLGHGQSCLLLGHWNISIDPFGAQIVDDAAAAEAAYQRACDARLGDACTLLSMRLLSRNDTAAAAVAAKSACDLDDVAGCIIRLRRGHLDGMRPCERSQRAACTRVVESLALHNTDDDAPTRYAALTRACDLRYGLACRTLSSIHAGSEGPPPNADFDSRHFLEKACAAGDELSCSQVDLEYDISLKAGKHIPRAVAFYEASCARKKATSCRKLADLHSAGTLITRDPARMISLYEQACDAGDATACAQLGREFQSGTSTPADPERARALFLKGCQHDNNRDACLLYVKSEDPRLADACISGDNASCTALETGFLYVLMETDKAVSDRFRPQFLDFYRRRCDAKQPAGCRGLGNIYRDAAGVPQDLTRARQLHEKACILEHVLAATADSPPAPLTTCYGLETLCGYFYADQASCVILGGWYDSGIILSQDTTRATEFFRQACTMGWSSARCTSIPAPLNCCLTL
jgi:TPR repeat protein